ncbi:unnamed protein product [Notodromas monacha]|uniref:Chitin-binding type-2 domain-containing protein n=1 Tax=Notodromas monacha TaxID=399045 RepID=A0A7R9GCP6_9CRUS|nr:unnamed protein product [Notodromas monacha]CAG0917871.1 unnamed protein product [Notodromas monacha]
MGAQGMRRGSLLMRLCRGHSLVLSCCFFWLHHQDMAQGRTRTSAPTPQHKSGNDINNEPYWDDYPPDNIRRDFLEKPSGIFHRHNKGISGQRHQLEETLTVDDKWRRVSAALMDSAFSCDFVVVPGYYADMESHCQIFHICTAAKRKYSFFCPEGTFFNQKHLICDWDGGNTCALSPYYYSSYSNTWYAVHGK